MTEPKTSDLTYMRRALQLAALGAGAVSPNPMVGAVIVNEDRIIGEGWHRRYGGPHAEVNAVADVSNEDLYLLPQSTIYVTLEPCSHWGKTPPCSRLLIEKGIKRIVIGSADPNPLVAGRGIRLLREAGREVVTGVLEKECMELNCRFMTAQKLRRPWIQLKFAVSADGFIGSPEGYPRLMLSNPLTSVFMHRERSMADAVMVGTNTVVRDNPRLDCRLWPGRTPKSISFDKISKLCPDARLLANPHVLKREEEDLESFLSRLFSDEEISSLMVEGGRDTLQEFMDLGLFDEIRIERSDVTAVAGKTGLTFSEAVKIGWIPAPRLPEGLITENDEIIGNNHIITLRPF